MSINETLGLVMLFLMIPVICIGFPISFTLLFLALVFGYIGMGTTVFDLLFFQTIGLMKEETLAAVPLFIFMGYILEEGGLMARLFRAFQLLLAPVRGSLYIGVLIIATIFGIAAGTVGPTVAMAAYYLKGVAPDWKLSDIYWGMAQFMVLQVIGLILCIVFPEIILWFPRWFFDQS